MLVELPFRGKGKQANLLDFYHESARCCTSRPTFITWNLLHRHRLRQVPRLIDICSFDQRHIVRQQL